MAGVPYVFGNATTSIPLTNLDANFNTGLTIGNTTVGLGNTVTTLGNVTLNNANFGAVANAVIYTNSGGNVTSNASVFTVDSNNNVGIGTTTPAVVGSSRKELTLKSTVADTYSILNLIGIRDVGGNQNGDVNFINSFGSQTITSRISGINGASSNTEGNLVFQTKTSAGALTEQLRINSTGALVLAGGTTTASGVGIAFPATQSASSDANTLDDYEKGTWTPQAGSESGAYTATYSLQGGKYVKIGNRVWATFDIQLASRTQTGSIAYVHGLPFPVVNNGDLSGSFGAPALTANIGTNFYQIGIYAQNAASYCYIVSTTSNSSGLTPISNAFWGTTTRLAGGVFYNTTS